MYQTRLLSFKEKKEEKQTSPHYAQIHYAHKQT